MVQILSVQNKGMSNLKQCYVLKMSGIKKQQDFRRKKKQLHFQPKNKYTTHKFLIEISDT